MAEVGLGGWELADLPLTVAEISQTWQRHFHQSQPLSHQQRQQIQHQVQQHQFLLERVFEET
jgi:hypothetical protein